MHAIITTQGFIVSSAPYGEAGKLISIFTRDLGLVRAVAQGIRFEKSKLRYHTNDYSFGVFSLVRGKEVWRLTNAQEIVDTGRVADVGMTMTKSLTLKEFWARIALLLRRLLQGEEANERLFEAIYACNIFLGLQPDMDLEVVESLLVLRIMHALGYVGDDKDIHGFIYSDDFAPALLDLAARKRTVINQHINKALRESHL